MREPLDVATRSLPDGEVRVLRLHRPGSGNALDTGLLTELVDALDDVEHDPGVIGLLVTGSETTFCAGVDDTEVLADGGRRRTELLAAVLERLTLLRRPSAAALEGECAGMGVELAAACDLRVAGTSATLRFTGPRDGVPAGVARTVGQVGLSVAKDWVLSGREVPGEEAFARGFVQRLVPDGDARVGAERWLGTVASHDPDAVALAKRLFDQHGGLRDRVAYEHDALRSQAETGRLPDLGADLPRTVRPRRR